MFDDIDRCGSTKNLLTSDIHHLQFSKRTLGSQVSWLKFS